ncbi:MAG: LysR family transcriptional regulator [Acidobacteria bacterium]|nr:LysR family transcriptional regulator [Acidobacteriota bacterium]
MEFYQLEYLVAVADQGGYNQAARHIYRVPSAIKRGVALLEQEVGVRLLRRDGRNVRLTEEGEEFVHWAREAIESRMEMMDRIQRAGPLRGRVVVAAGQAILAKAIPRLKTFMNRNPQVEILVLRRRGFEIAPLIEQGEADFGYLPLEYCPASLHWHRCVEIKMLLAIPKRLPLAKKRTVTLKDLSQVPLILSDRQASSGRRIHRIFQEHGLEYRTLVETGDSRLLLGFVGAGLGISILQEQEIVQAWSRQVKFADVSRLFGKQVEGIAWRKRGYLSKAARRLMEALVPDAPLGSATDQATNLLGAATVKRG